MVEKRAKKFGQYPKEKCLAWEVFPYTLFRFTLNLDSISPLVWLILHGRHPGRISRTVGTPLRIDLVCIIVIITASCRSSFPLTCNFQLRTFIGGDCRPDLKSSCFVGSVGSDLTVGFLFFFPLLPSFSPFSSPSPFSLSSPQNRFPFLPSGRHGPKKGLVKNVFDFVRKCTNFV